jgi:hypothetical protein
LSTTTPNFGLTKPAGSDLIDISVLNGNFDILDGTGILVFQTFTDLMTTLPNGYSRPVWVVADNEWYYWTGALAVNVSSVIATSSITAIAPVVSIAGSITVASILATVNTQAIAPVIFVPGNITVSPIVATATAQALNPTLSIPSSVNVSALLAQSSTAANAPTVTATTTNLNPTNATLYLNSDDLAGQTLTTSGLTWQDRSGNGYNIALSLGWGTSVALDVNANGIFNPGGGQFNGSKLTTNLTPFQTKVFTWEFEFVCGNAATSAAYTLQNETGTGALYIDINGSGLVTFHGGVPWYHQYTPAINLHDGNKHILQIISDGTTVKHYIDGTLQYTWTIGANPVIPSGLTDLSLWFTANASNNASNGIGRLRRVRFYTTALSDADRETSRTTL